MESGDDKDTWIALEFQERLLEDRAAGRELTLTDYLPLYPGHEEAIAREWVAGQSSPSEDTDTLNPQSLGAYAIEGELGRGGQGVVYRARDTRLGRVVALKVLSALHNADEKLLTRFRREATVASGLDHPGICTVYEFGTDHGTPFIAMRLVDGRSLAEWIQEERPGRKTGSPLTEVEQRSGDSQAERRAEDQRVRRFLEIMASAAEALACAHEAGVVHRDLKPANIMVTAEGTGVLTDFGLARMEGSGHTLTASGELFGTPGYLSPEQLNLTTGRHRPL